MKASAKNPIYTVYIISGGTKYNVTPAVIALDFSDQKKQLAQSVVMDLMNVRASGKLLTGIVQVRDRVFIYANDGNRSEEVFRGYVWTRSYSSSLQDRELRLRCYDNLIYQQESEDAEYFSAGKSSKDVMSALCEKWGVKLDYSYESITHSGLALRGNLADIFTSDVLDLVKDRTGKKYVIRSEKDVMRVLHHGSNSTVYSFKAGENAISASSECTMDGMTTKVVILGKADDEGHQPVEATLNGKTSEYGTLQKLINRNENTTLADAKKEAEGILKDNGSPKWEFEVRAPDVPWIRKGDRVHVNAGDIVNSYLIAVSVDRIISSTKKEMTLTLETCEDAPIKTEATDNPETPEKTETDTQPDTTARFTLTIKNAGQESYWGSYSLYVNGNLKRSGKAEDLSLTLKYRDFVKIVPTGASGHSYRITETEFNMKYDKTVTITWI